MNHMKYHHLIVRDDYPNSQRMASIVSSTYNNSITSRTLDSENFWLIGLSLYSKIALSSYKHKKNMENILYGYYVIIRLISNVIWPSYCQECSIPILHMQSINVFFSITFELKKTIANKIEIWDALSLNTLLTPSGRTQ